MRLEVSIRKKLRDFVLDAEFTVCDEVFALLGASGAGKSMTLKIIAGLIRADAGRIVLNNRVLFDTEKKIDLPPQARRVGYLFQNYALFPNMAVTENILFASTGSTEEKVRKLDENLNRFNLRGLEQAYPHELSGGQAQRVAFARVLTSHAELLLLDEPFSALDTHLKWQLEAEVAELFKIYGAAILVSHDSAEVYRLADTVAVMHAGRLEALGSKRELYKNPPTAAAARLVGCRNISAAHKIAEDLLFAEAWQLTLRAQKIPDDLKFIGVNEQALEIATSGENVFAFEVVKAIEEPLDFLVSIRYERGEPLLWRTEKILSGEVTLRLPADKILMLRG